MSNNKEKQQKPKKKRLQVSFNNVTSSPNISKTSSPTKNNITMSRSHSQMSSSTKEKERKQNELTEKLKKKMKEIGRTHPEFELSYDLLLGIRTSTSLVNKSIIIKSSQKGDIYGNDSSDEDDEEQLDSEFLDNKRYSFPSTGSTITPSHAMNDFEFKDYCRPIFAQLREWFGVTPQEYLVKLCGGFNLLEFISNSKSGQFFFYSHDGQFLIKSMTRSECKFLRKILPPLYHYIKNQPNTLLTKFYGMYRVKTPNRQPIYFVVMGSVFYTHYDIHRIYDIKGSTHGRNANTKDLKAVTPVLKDLDWVALGQKLEIGNIKAKMFKEQLRRDTQLLKKLKIMDYSLLIGIHYMNETDLKQALSDHSNPKQYEKDVESGKIKPTQVSYYSEDDINNNKIKSKHNKGTWSQNIPPIILQKANEIKIDNNNNNNHNDINNNIEIKKPLLKQSNTSVTQDDAKLDNNSLKDQTNINKKNKNKDKGDEFHMDHDAFNEAKKKLTMNIKKRVESRRLSELDSKHKGKYIIKTPIKSNFDVPELINLNRYDVKYNVKKSKKVKNKPVKNHVSDAIVTVDTLDDDLDESKTNTKDKNKDSDSEKEFEFSESLFAKDEGGMYSVDKDGKRKNCIYFCGIIDILQKYNKRKKVENFLRGLNTDTTTISAVPPAMYSQRMYEFLRDTII